MKTREASAREGARAFPLVTLLLLILPSALTRAQDSSAIPPGMVRVPGGSFMMGSPASEIGRKPDEGPPVPVVLVYPNRGLLFAARETSQAEWKRVMGSNPSRTTGDSLPVENVSWYDAVIYCNRMSLESGRTPCYSLGGLTDPDGWGSAPASDSPRWSGMVCDFSADGFRLPTEAEWEYACRAGTTTATAFGNGLSAAQANINGAGPYGGAPAMPFIERTVPVGGYAPNAWGLYDMHGNVLEWCWDHYGDYASLDHTNPTGARNGEYRIARGGSWIGAGVNARSAFRGRFPPTERSYTIGFRIVCLE